MSDILNNFSHRKTLSYLSASCAKDIFLWYNPCLPPANEVWGKVIFLHLSVILFTEGICPIACWDTQLTPRTRGWYPPWTRGRHPPRPEAGTPQEQTSPEQTPPRAQCMLGDTGNKRAVCILLECKCNLFFIFFLQTFIIIVVYHGKPNSKNFFRIISDKTKNIQFLCTPL